MAVGTAFVTVAGTSPWATASAGGALGAALGVPAGCVARRLLGGLRRGADVRPPVCEAAVGALWAAVGAATGARMVPVAWLPAMLGLSWLAVVAGTVDLRHRRLPDALTLPAAAVAPVAVLPLGLGAVGRGLAEAAVAFAGNGLAHLLAPASLGAGDAKLAASLGVVLGAVSWSALAAAAVLSAAGTLVMAVLPVRVSRMIRAGPAAGSAVGSRSPWRSRAVAHGPSMLAATWLVVAGVMLTCGGQAPSPWGP